MIVFQHYPVLAPPLHGALGWTDEFVCIGLIAVVLVIATFLVRGGQTEDDKNARPADSDQSAKK